MLQRALSKAKKEGGKKIPINFQVPGELKEQFEDLCKKNEVSITSMLTGLMETAIEEAQGIYFELTPDSLMAINNRIDELNKIRRRDYYEKLDADNGYILKEVVEDLPGMKQALEDIDNELYRLNKIFNAYGSQK